MSVPDPVLVHLASHLERAPKSEYGLTLTVRGTIISGIMISPQAYSKAVGEQFRNGLGGHERGLGWDVLFDAIAEAADDRAAAFEASFAADDREKMREIPDPEFIHLREAHVLMASGMQPNGSGSMWWRGRLADVEGWSPGTLGSSLPEA